MKKSQKIVVTALLMFIASQVVADGIQERKKKILELESKKSSLSTDRKLRSEKILTQFKVPINKSLPTIAHETEALRRTKVEVANRTLALLVVAVKAEGLEQKTVEKVITSYGIESNFSPKERLFINATGSTQQDKTQFIWRYEAAWTLLWALGFIDELLPPTKICDVPKAVSFMQKRTKDQFINDAKLRSLTEILDATDLVYRYHWALVDARINGRAMPANINNDVVQERHYALNWLIGYMNQKWDDISTDT